MFVKCLNGVLVQIYCGKKKVPKRRQMTHTKLYCSKVSSLSSARASFSFVHVTRIHFPLPFIIPLECIQCSCLYISR